MNTAQRVCLSFYGLLVIFWLSLFVTHTVEGFYNYLYSFLFGLIPLIGGAVAMSRAHVWGGLKSAVGSAVLFIGFGVFLWGCGETIWSYYNFVLNVPAPYPSLADLGFAPSIFFYGIGAIFLSKATGAKYGLRNPVARLFAIIAPFAILAFCYYMSIQVARAGVLIPEGESTLKAILDVAYPLGDFIGLSVAILVSGLSFRYLGGMYKIDIYAILAGLAFMFIGDTIFSYATTVGTYYNANFGDLMLTTGTFLLTFGVLGFMGLKRSD